MDPRLESARFWRICPVTLPPRPSSITPTVKNGNEIPGCQIAEGEATMLPIRAPQRKVRSHHGIKQLGLRKGTDIGFDRDVRIDTCARDRGPAQPSGCAARYGRDRSREPAQGSIPRGSRGRRRSVSRSRHGPAPRWRPIPCRQRRRRRPLSVGAAQPPHDRTPRQGAGCLRPRRRVHGAVTRHARRRARPAHRPRLAL